MKAYFVWVGDPGLDWGDYFHAETQGKAKAAFWREWHWEVDEYIHLRPRRCPEYDDKPFPEDWEPYSCKCEVCRDG